MGKIVEFAGFDVPVNVNHRPGTLASASCSIVAAPAPPYGTNSLHIAPHKTTAFYRPGDLHTFTAASFAMASFYTEFGSNDPTNANPIDSLIAVVDENSTAFWRIRVDDSGGPVEHHLYDGSGALLHSLGWSGGQRRFTMIWEIDDATGDWVVYYDTPGTPLSRNAGTALFGGSDAKADFTPGGGGTQMSLYLGGQGGDQPPPDGDCDVYHSGCYLADDVAGPEDVVGVQEGKNGDFLPVYDDGKLVLASLTPECDETGAIASLDDLDAGNNWSVAGDANLATAISYTLAAGSGGTTHGGGVRVPAPLSRPSDYIYGAAWIGYAKGPGTACAVVHGWYEPLEPVVANRYLNVDNTIPTPRMITTAYKYWRVVQDPRDEFGDFVRVDNGQMVIGIAVQGGAPERISYLAEAWCGTLHAIEVVTGKASIGKTARNVRGKRRWL